MSITGKKLLILGGVTNSCEIIKQAQKQGVYVIVTDYLSDSPGKKVADKSFMISTTNLPAVVELINKEKIDGILTGFLDSMLPYYQEICKKSGLPCYGTKEQFRIATNKNCFKQLCRQYHVPVVEEFSVSYPLKQSDINKLTYPVLVKPVDYSGSRGVYICKNRKEFKNNYKKSLTFSPCGEVLTERLMNSEEATIFYLIQDGEIILSAMADRHLNRNQDGVVPLPVAYIFPSKHLKIFQEELNNKVIEMFTSIGIQNGIIFIQSFVEDGNCIFYEMGYRLTGSLEYKIISKLNGINPIEMMINFALTGKMNEEQIKERINPNYDQWGCNITFLAKPGKIGVFKGIEKTMVIDGVIDVVPNYNEGDVIPKEARGTLQQVVMRAFATAQTKQELINVMDQIHDSIKVYADDGSDMLLDVFETKKLNE